MHCADLDFLVKVYYIMQHFQQGFLELQFKKMYYFLEVLGEKMCSLYSQDRETRSQEINRIALQEFRSEVLGFKDLLLGRDWDLRS